MSEQNLKNLPPSLKFQKRTRQKTIDRLVADKDFVASPDYNNSLSKISQDYSSGLPDKLVAKILRIKFSSFSTTLKDILDKLKKQMS